MAGWPTFFRKTAFRSVKAELAVDQAVDLV
jgi:hypothetical protein